jgi:small GTP-binding protein
MTDNEDNELLKFKVVLLGDGGVGKTSLVRRYVMDQFDDKYLVTMGAKTSHKKVSLKAGPKRELECDLQIWDVMGQKQFQNLHKTYVKGAQGGIIISDLTQPESLRSTEEWTKMLFGVTGPVPLVYGINKFDLLDRSPFKQHDIDGIVNSNKGLIFPVSAKTGLNVEALFVRISELICERVLKEDISSA